MHLAEMLGSRPSPLWDLVRQCGIDRAVGTMHLRRRKDQPDLPGTEATDAPWSLRSLERIKRAYDDGGFRLEVLESRPPLNRAKLGLPGRDEEIETVIELVRNLGQIGVPVWCYEWMPVYNWLRTSTTVELRGGALGTGYDHTVMQREPENEHAPLSEETLWESLVYFLDAVLPEAERAGVKLAMHPDDPPLSPIRGLGRIMRSIDNFQRLLDLRPSPASGIALCQGNFTLMTDDLPAVIRTFGAQGKIFFVHLRDVRGTPENFIETFHDEGKTDLLACMQAYHDTGFDGVARPDHVPTMGKDTNERPGYSQIGRLFAIGYLKGLQEAVWGKRQATP